MGDGCSPKLATTSLLRFLLLVLIPCICALVVLLVILLSFVGTLKKAYFKSNGSELLITDGEIQGSDIILTNTVYDKSTVASTDHRTQPIPAWTTDASLPGDQGHRNASACMNITHSQCQMLPYHATLTPLASVIKNMDMEKFLKFFMYLHRLSCYQHIMLFGCSIAFPECIIDADDSRELLPCRSFCEAAKEGCESVLEMVNYSWPNFLKCSQFRNQTENSNVSRICFSPQEEKVLCDGGKGFLCASGICIPRKLQCNGYNDCDDWSDEAHCNCSENLFHCHTGKCLNYSLVCDGYDDCGDLSDEQNCDCHPATEHRCGDGRCIPTEWVCDGDHDCVDKSDEVNCSCHSQGLVECRNGQCIPSTFQCDGDEDCEDGSDEDRCSDGQTPCHEGNQRCLYNSCLESCGGSSLCDPNNSLNNCSQCEPITLELCMNLPYNHTNYPNYLGHETQKEASISWESSLFPALVQTNCYKYLMFFACTILVPKCDVNTGQRIPPCRILCEHSKEHCESVLGIVGLQWPEDTDCDQFPEENSDNQTCLMPDKDVEECSPSHFKCRSGRCVLASRRCDGQADCADDSDEENCGCKERDLWECPSNKQCLKQTVICDGFPDCPDNMDEKNCCACMNITHSQCQMLPYHATLTPLASVIKNMDMEKFLKFFMYLHRLSCYQHIMLFGCSIAFPECIIDADDSRELLPCRSFCEAAKEGCESVLEMVNYSWPNFLKCSQFRNQTENSNVSRICFSPQEEKVLCDGGKGFLCASGICIPRKLQCNGYNDCDDWSDEAHCNCSENLFHCHTGKCLNYSLVCDGYDDCGDLSDEQNCDCHPATEHRCGDGRCIPTEWVCDGDHDCVDKSDEVNCSCHSQGLVECRNGQCIPSTFQCDGDEDCEDGSDEDRCSDGQTPCHEGNQRCLYNSCLESCGGSSLCDPNNSLNNCSQCEPITLELCMNLPYNHTNYPNYLGHETQKEASISWESSLFPALVQTNCYKYLMFFACTILVPKCDVNTGQRIPPCRILCEHSKEHCESVLGIVGLQWPEDTDCDQFPEENSDNQTCLMPDKDVEECSPSHFKCRSGRCVLASRRCDGQADCADDSDEENCGCKERDLWECPSNKQCLKQTVICDGFPDCPDNMDEKNCSFCQDDELECANHACVSRDLWCDGEADCSDSSDEWDCVTLSKNANSSSLLTVHRSATEHHVCADGWQEMLSQLACKQMGLGEPSVTKLIQEQEQDQQWLSLHSEWESLSGTTLHELLVNGQSCQSRSKVSLLCTKQDCGRRPAARMNKRILGGRTSRPGRWPWQCSLQSEPSGHICGCVLIAKKWVLTVAHCFEGRENAAIWKVVLGINNLDHPSVFMQMRLVKTIILHPHYSRAVVDYDISIVELSEDINETSYVRPVCLPSPEQSVEPDTYCYITGWGHMGNKMPFKLQEGEVRIISPEQCQSYFDVKTITTRMICAGYEFGTVDSCMGDSGGPLVCEQRGGQWILFGLTSWGSVCFSKLLGPGVYSNVSYFVEWIERQIYIQTFLLN